MALSFVALLYVREPVGGPVAPRVALRAHLARVPELLRRDRNLSWFLAARATAIVGQMAVGFYTVYALRAWAAPASQAAVFTALLVAGTVAGTLAFAWLADHAGPSARHPRRDGRDPRRQRDGAGQSHAVDATVWCSCWRGSSRPRSACRTCRSCWSSRRATTSARSTWGSAPPRSRRLPSRRRWSPACSPTRSASARCSCVASVGSLAGLTMLAALVRDPRHVVARARGGVARVKAVLLDLDDTLLDYSGGAEQCWAQACAAGAERARPDGAAGRARPGPPLVLERSRASPA